MSLKSIIEEEVLSILQKSKVDIDQISLEVPRYEHGDYSTNIAFRLTKILKKSPIDIADHLSNILNENTINFSTSAINGFINLKLTNEYLNHYFHSFLKTPLNINSDQKILLEYVSANPTGPLHIGHGRWAVIGDCIYRLLKAVGINVSNEFYINDAGNQVKLFNESINAYKKGEKSKEHSYGGYFIEYVSKESNNDQHVEFTINYQKNTLKKINCEFDTWFKESYLHENNNIKEAICLEYKDYIYEKDNALWFKTTSFNDDKDRVIVKENGDLTYFAADIIYHLNKINRGYTSIINIWGADHHGYIERIKSCIKAKNKNINLIVILGQLVNLYKNGKQIKMSKRTGDLIELSEVIDEIGVDATR